MPSTSPRNILVAVDGSVYSERAFAWYADKFRQERDQVVFVHVYESPITPAPTFANCMSIPPREEWERMLEKAEQQAEEMLSGYEKKCKEMKLPFKTLFAYGAIGHVICSVGKEEKAECIILGSRGLGTIRRTILGSVSDYVTQHMTIPVLIVPAEERR